MELHEAIVVGILATVGISSLFWIYILKEKERKAIELKYKLHPLIDVEYHKILFHFYNISLAFGEQAERVAYQHYDFINEVKLHQFNQDLYQFIKGGKEIITHIFNNEEIKNAATKIDKEACSLLQLYDSILRHLKSELIEENKRKPEQTQVEYYRSNAERIQKELKLRLMDYTELCVQYHSIMIDNYNLNKNNYEQPDKRNK